MLRTNLKNIAILTSLIIVLVTISLPGQLSSVGTAISLLLFVILGVPHGANDFILFKKNNPKRRNKIVKFLVGYTVLSGAVFVTWQIMPLLALIVFLSVVLCPTHPNFNNTCNVFHCVHVCLCAT